MSGTQLYDESSNPIYPQTDAKNVSSGVIVTGNTVDDDLRNLLSRYQTLANLVSGAAAVENELGIIVEYSANNCNNITDASQATYGETLVFPTAANPYLWQKTQYLWGETIVKTTYTIAATALFPETQIMFAVGQLDLAIGGPSEYVDGNQDTITPSILWYTYPNRDISNDAPCAYIATRTRGANETWQGKNFHAAKYGQYPVV